jgi:hypothetical protein
MRRDFRRAALLRCRIPFSAALSKDLIAWWAASWASSSFPSAISRRVFLMYVRAADRRRRFRWRLRAFCLIRFIADLVFANLRFLLNGSSHLAINI